MISQMDGLGEAPAAMLMHAEREASSAQRAELGWLAAIFAVAAVEIVLLFVAFG